MTARVDAIHPDLQWETSVGTAAKHVLCLTGSGVADLRPLAERWLRSAPSATGMWEFAAARQRDANILEAQLGFAGTTLDIAQTRAIIQVDDDRMRIDVQVFHPAFAEIPFGSARQATFLMLNWLLGEDDVERWLAVIECIAEDRETSLPLVAVRETVDAMATRHVDPVWLLLEATTSTGDRALIAAVRPLRWIDHPLLDLHSEVHVPFDLQRDDGLPTSDALDILREYEDALVDTLGISGMVLAHETFAGQRVFHIYTDSDDQHACDIIDNFRPAAEATLIRSMDPGWKHMRAFADR
jgi:hypothetical protein